MQPRCVVFVLALVLSTDRLIKCVAVEDIVVVSTQYNQILAVGIQSGAITVLAGSGDYELSDGVAVRSGLMSPRQLAFDSSGGLIITSQAGHCIRRLFKGNLTTIAGNGIPGYVDGLGSLARFSEPVGIVASPNGTVMYVADALTHRIRVLARLGPGANDEWMVTTLAGSGASTRLDGVGTNAALFIPYSLSWLNDTTLLLVEREGYSLRAAHVPSGTVSTLALLSVRPNTALVDSAGDLLITSGFQLLRLNMTTRNLTALAGQPDTLNYVIDGVGTNAVFSLINHFCFVDARTLVVADSYVMRLVKLDNYSVRVLENAVLFPQGVIRADAAQVRVLAGTGVLAGAIVAAVGGAALLLLVLICLFRRRRTHSRSATDTSGRDSTSAVPMAATGAPETECASSRGGSDSLGFGGGSGSRSSGRADDDGIASLATLDVSYTATTTRSTRWDTTLQAHTTSRATGGQHLSARGAAPVDSVAFGIPPSARNSRLARVELEL